MEKGRFGDSQGRWRAAEFESVDVFNAEVVGARDGSMDY